MSQQVEQDSKTDSQEEQPKKLKICCACPETKKVRDACIVERGEDQCKELIEAHLQCLRDQGFDI